jgi:negative regulator of sigma E activity
MKPELSALFDGELESHEVRPLLRGAVNDPAMQDAWQAYALIGDQLRREYRGEPDLTAGVMARIREEPVVLAPRNLTRQTRHHPLFALAASVAGVAVVAWLSLVEDPLNAVSPAPTIARLADTPQKPQVAAAKSFEQAPLRGEINEYLLAHHTQAASFRLGDSADNIRTVTMTSRMNRP